MRIWENEKLPNGTNLKIMRETSAKLQHVRHVPFFTKWGFLRTPHQRTLYIGPAVPVRWQQKNPCVDTTKVPIIAQTARAVIAQTYSSSTKQRTRTHNNSPPCCSRLWMYWRKALRCVRGFQITSQAHGRNDVPMISKATMARRLWSLLTCGTTWPQVRCRIWKWQRRISLSKLSRCFQLQCIFFGRTPRTPKHF